MKTANVCPKRGKKAHIHRQLRPMIFFVMLGLVLVGSALVGAAEAPVKLVWLDETGEWHQPWVDEMLDSFHAQYPHITVEYVPSPGGKREEITVQMATGIAPDVVVGFETFFRNWAEAGFLLDLRPYIERDREMIDVDDIPQIMWDTFVVHQGPQRGIQYAIPKSPNVFLLTVNVDHFDAAGLNLRDDWTWDDLLAYARALTRSREGEVERWGVHLQDLNFRRLLSWVWANGGDAFDFPDNPTRFRLQEDEAVTALEWVRDLVHVHQVAAPVSGGARAGLVDGKWSMAFDGTSAFRQLDSAENLRWDIMPRPEGAAGRGNMVSVTGQGIYSGTQHPEEAWLLLRHITSPESLGKYTPLTGRQASRLSALQAYVDNYPHISVSHVMDAVTGQVGMVPDVTVIDAERIIPLIDQAIQRSVVTDEVAVRVAIDEIVPIIESIYDELASRPGS